MNAPALIARLERFGRSLPAMVEGLNLEDLRWKPPSGNWSILEALCHLADEEAEDFRARLAFILEKRPGEWPRIDPEGWATARQYNQQKPAEVIKRFVDQRQHTVVWLASLAPSTDWSLAYEHPRFGPIRAGDMLASWAAHDALHLRQIAKRLHEMAARDGGEEYRTLYAGEWSA